MAEVKVFYDRTGNSLTVWFGNPQDEFEAEETGDEVILMKDKSDRVIGFEKLNFHQIFPPLNLTVKTCFPLVNPIYRLLGFSPSLGMIALQEYPIGWQAKRYLELDQQILDEK